jgi:arylsulfatase A-like enzyme
VRKVIAVAIAAATAMGCRQADVRPPQPPVNILLVTIDTFRADRLGIGVAPTLDRLAAEGVQFTSARSAVPLTLPSHTTILTGLLPPAHGVRENGIDALSDAHPTAATLLKAAGYRTAAFVGAFVLDRRFGLARGFDTYDDQIPRDPAATDRLEAERPARVVVDHALAWLDGSLTSSLPAPRTPPAPFFMWIHLYDPHAPYSPPPEFLRQVEKIRRESASSETRIPSPGSVRYDGEIAYVDAQVARIVDWMRAHALMDRLLIVVAGDHGEGLGDHGEQSHGMLLYDSTLRVPLIIASPRRAPSKREEAVSLGDIAPTILQAAALDPPPDMTGRNLLAEVSARPSAFAEVSYAETEYPRVSGWASLQALTDGRWKTIRAGGEYEVYDLHNDPREERNLASTQATILTAMAARMEAIHSSGQTSGSARTMSPEAEQRLRALGYVSGSAQTRTGSNFPNAATRIDAWNAFEDALSELNSHRAGALPALKGLAAANPDAPVFQTTYARALKEAGDVSRALAVYREAARRWPTDATLLHDLAVAAREAASLRSEATRAEGAAVSLAPASAMSHNGLGLIAVDDDRPADAVAEFERAAALDPNNASYWTNLGNARRGIADRAGAEQALFLTTPESNANGASRTCTNCRENSNGLQHCRCAIRVVGGTSPRMP